MRSVERLVKSASERKRWWMTMAKTVKRRMSARREAVRIARDFAGDGRLGRRSAKLCKINDRTHLTTHHCTAAHRILAFRRAATAARPTAATAAMAARATPARQRAEEGVSGVWCVAEAGQQRSAKSTGRGLGYGVAPVASGVPRVEVSYHTGLNDINMI